MPAPQGSTIKLGTLSRLPSNFDKTWPTLNDFLTAICGDIAQAWTMWEAGLLAGDNNVTGAGLGVWVGVGSGGKLTEGVPFTTINTWPKDDQAGDTKTLMDAISSELKKEFNMFDSSYVFGSVDYTGLSTATPVTPGVFTATIASGTVAVDMASGQTPQGFAANVRQALPSSWKPETLDKFLKALEGSIVEQFGIWIQTAIISGDIVTGVSAPGSGAGVGVSAGNGTVM
jgi:hypothetical protein